MDVARPDLARKKKFRQTVYAVAAVMVVVVITVGVSRLEPAAPRVDRDTIYLDTVQRGPMVRQVRGTGTLVPEQIRWIPATTDGTVERIVIRPGALVAPDTVILDMSNPELAQSALEARLNLEAAEARYSNRQVEVERELLNQRATLATTEAQLKTARLQADADGQLFAQGLVSSLQLQQSQSAEQEFDTRYALEQERLQMATDTVEAQLAVEQAEVDRLRTLYELRRQQVADLRVRAGMPGVLQQVPLEEGQRIATGTNLARVGDPAVLKAELRIAETQAKDMVHSLHCPRVLCAGRHIHAPWPHEEQALHLERCSSVEASSAGLHVEQTEVRACGQTCNLAGPATLYPPVVHCRARRTRAGKLSGTDQYVLRRWMASPAVRSSRARGRLKCGRTLLFRPPDGASSRLRRSLPRGRPRDAYSGTGDAFPIGAGRGCEH